MIDFTTVTKDICIFYLGGVAGNEGPLLNILKTSDNHYYFDYFVYDTVHYNDDKAIHIIKETSLDTIKQLFDKKTLSHFIFTIFSIPKTVKPSTKPKNVRLNQQPMKLSGNVLKRPSITMNFLVSSTGSMTTPNLKIFYRPF